MKRHVSFAQWGIVITFFGFLLLSSACQPPGNLTPTPSITPSPFPSATPSPSAFTPPVIERYADNEFGVAWANSPYANVSSSGRIAKAQEAGATWDRWSVYWYWVEQPMREGWGSGRDNFHWSGDLPLNGDTFDINQALEANEGNLQTLAILDGIPRFYDCAWEEAWSPDHPDGSGCYGTADNRITNDRIAGLSLEPADGNPINEANRWAAYVYTTVVHLSQNGINHFEIWNEPDLGNKWNQPNDPATEDTREPGWSYVDDYANMVHATTVAAQRANPTVQLVLGAPTSNDEIFIPGDPINPKPTDGWVGNAWLSVSQRGFDEPLHAIAIHSYGWSFFTPLIAARATELIDKPIWITESGLAVNDCESGHICANDEDQVADYLIQHYAYARAIDAEVIFHHRLRDDNADDGNFGLYSDADTPRAALAAAQVVNQYLQGAIFLKDDSIVPKFTRNDFANFSLPFVKLVFEQSNARVTVLWAHKTKPVPAGEVEIQAWGSNISLINSQGEVVYHRCEVKPGDLITIPQELEGAPQADRLQITLIVDGEGGQKEEIKRPAIGGPTYILVETNEPCDTTPPVGSAALIWSNHNCVAYPDHTYISGYDDQSGLDHFTMACSPVQSHDLSWTAPDRFYAGTVNAIPPAKTTCLLTLYDRAGNSTQQKLYNPGPHRISGCDHPDDNFSAAGSAALPAGQWFELPAGARTAPRVAVLNGGFAGNLLKALFDLGEPAVLVDDDFDPVATVAQYPVLLIPSGGLYGLEHSASFRARLEEYTRRGGTVVAFDQQHGYEYGALPGGQVGGYGWAEDISCFRSSLYLAEWHPALSGFRRATLNAHVDGYFTHVPTGTHTLLSRTANGQPGARSVPGRLLR